MPSSSLPTLPPFVPEVACVGAGPFNGAHFAAEGFARVVAIDGGFAALKAMGLAPNEALGDFDSLGWVPEGPHVHVYPAEKDFSDTEIAVNRLLELGVCSAAFYGVLGGRLDHTIAALQVLVGAAQKGLRLVAVGDECMVAVLWGSGAGAIELVARERGIVSVFSATDSASGVCIEGLKYEARGIELANTQSLGLSNEFVGLPARISVERGCLLVVVPPMPLSDLRLG